MRASFTALVLAMFQAGLASTVESRGGSADLQGEWRLRGEGPLVASLVIYKDETYIFTILPRYKQKGKFTVRNDKHPNHIDFIITEGVDNGKTMLGLFEIKKKESELVLCIGRPGGQRPKELRDDPKNGILLWRGKKR
jgi:uncharacterized protein (TIGR03067 family)